MSRLPPNLLYLTIYNPTLRPSQPISDDDEDAEEQAHILFYTSKERAVSRDRMLRQIGLAKALVNFAENFNPEDPCNTVHSQSRRMIMVSPEPDFWIHAGIELAKTPRAAPVDNGKRKDKEKGKTKISEKGKGKEKEPPTLYEYHDASVHDVAARADLLRGYERFKLKNGSFTSILATLGQQALEIQLERFFTVWAWSWNLEDGYEFGDHLGVPLHPLHRTLIPHLDAFSSQIPDAVASIIITPSYVIPSTRYRRACYPSSLALHLLSLLPPPPQTPTHIDPAHDLPEQLEDTFKPKRPPDFESRDVKKGSGDSNHGSDTFLGMPTMNLSVPVNMDMRTWSWPGYLTFGKGQGKKSPKRLPEEQTASKVELPDAEPSSNTEAAHFDKNALDDAIASDSLSAASVQVPDTTASSQPVSTSGDATSAVDNLSSAGLAGDDEPEETSLTVEAAQIAPAQSRTESDSSRQSPVNDDGLDSPVPSPEFLATNVYLGEDLDASMSRRRRVFYMADRSVLVALAGLDSDGAGPSPPELQSIARKVVKLFDIMKISLDDESSQSASDLYPSATRILQPKDHHIISAQQFTLSDDRFSSRSIHLYDAQQLLESDNDIHEVFSRGQNPQHWHIGRRGLDTQVDDADGDVYMEVFRKEASLTDVDNTLAGVIRKYITLDS